MLKLFDVRIDIRQWAWRCVGVEVAVEVDLVCRAYARTVCPSIIQMAHQKPRLANTDYTHLTHEGGRVIGLSFARLFVAEQAAWKAKNAAGMTQ